MIVNYIREFGIKIFLITSFSRVIRILRIPQKVIGMYVNWKNRYLSKWLWNKFHSIVATNDKRTFDSYDDNYVFVFWLQGEKLAPPIVKACIQSIRKNCSNRKVVVLDKNNYKQYATLPESVLKHYKQGGGVSNAHFSDVLRFELLREHGGVWIDATDFISMQIPNYVFDFSFYSLNGAYASDLGWKWTSWFMAAKKGDLLVENMCRFYEAYWNTFNCAITYLFLDCWVLALYNHITAIRKNIDALPDCKGQCYTICTNWDKPYSQQFCHNLINSFFVNKLTYKGSLPPIEDNGKLTVFGKLLKSMKYDC